MKNPSFNLNEVDYYSAEQIARVFKTETRFIEKAIRRGELEGKRCFGIYVASKEAVKHYLQQQHS